MRMHASNCMLNNGPTHTKQVLQGAMSAQRAKGGQSLRTNNNDIHEYINCTSVHPIVRPCFMEHPVIWPMLNKHSVGPCLCPVSANFRQFLSMVLQSNSFSLLLQPTSYSGEKTEKNNRIHDFFHVSFFQRLFSKHR